MRTSRKPIAFSAIAIAALAASFRVDASVPASEVIDFLITRDHATIGRHVLDIQRRGDDIHVDIAIDIEITMLFMKLFAYKHRSHEVRRGGRLISLDARTDDDGTAYWVAAKATPAGLAVSGSGGRFTAPADTLTTGYWSYATVGKSRLLDSQHGKLVDVRISPMGSERIDTANGTVPSRRYEVDGDLRLTLWYSPDGQWLKSAFAARGAEVEYRLRRHSAPARLAVSD